VVLAFLPRAFTGVCEKELVHVFGMPLNDFVGANTAVVGVASIRHSRTRSSRPKNGLNFPLLSDLTRDVIRKYDVVFNDLGR